MNRVSESAEVPQDLVKTRSNGFPGQLGGRSVGECEVEWGEEVGVFI